MPTRNTRKEYVAQTYYHVYSRGANKQPIFEEEQDYTVFLEYLHRYLSPERQLRPNGQIAHSFANYIDLLCYCLMPNHVHFLFYQYDDERALPALLQRIFTTYSMYFNKKYGRTGPVFQSRYLASRIDSDSYLYHISRYIHRNPSFWSEYEFSSLRYYIGEAQADWVKPQAIMDLFDNDPSRYLKFVSTADEDDEEQIVDSMAHE